MNLVLRSASVLALFAAALSANAQFVGSSVNGILNFGFPGQNLFNPSTTTVVDPGVEFSYTDYANTDSVDVTANSIVLTDVVTNTGSNSNINIILTDAAFAGFTFTKTSDSFLNGGVRLTRTGNTLSFSIPDIDVTNGQRYSATFVANPTPEPATMAALGLGAVAMLRRRKCA